MHPFDLNQVDNVSQHFDFLLQFLFRPLPRCHRCHLFVVFSNNPTLPSARNGRDKRGQNILSIGAHSAVYDSVCVCGETWERLHANAVPFGTIHFCFCFVCTETRQGTKRAHYLCCISFVCLFGHCRGDDLLVYHSFVPIIQTLTTTIP